MIATTGKHFYKIHEVRMIYPGWFSMELPVKDLFLLATITMITVNMSFTHFHSSSCQGNIFLHQNHATYYISTNYNWENGVKQKKITEENLSQSSILWQLLRTKTPASRSKCITYFCCCCFYHYLPYICWVDKWMWFM